MEFSDLIRQRRACHNFLPGKSIPAADFIKMIEETSLTPSGYNAQPWEFIIIREEENIKAIQKIAFEQTHLEDASAIVIVLADTEIGRNVEQLLDDWINYGYCTPAKRPTYRNSIAKTRSPEKKKIMALRNAMLAAMTLIYSAENLGYATCPIMGFSQHQLSQHLSIPADREIALMIALGYRAPSSSINHTPATNTKPSTTPAATQKNSELPRLPRKQPKEMIHWEKF